MGHAKALLFVDDDQAKPLKFDRFGQQGVGADDNIHFAAGEAFLGLFRLGGRHQPRQPSDFDGEGPEALFEIVEMLAGEEGRRSDDRDLHAGHGGGKGGAHRDLGLAEADIATDQTVHRPAGGHVGKHFLDRLLLVIGLLIGKTVDKTSHLGGLHAGRGRGL